MKQFPLSRTDLIKIRDTNKSEQVRVLLREISRLHQVMRALNIQIERIYFDIANGRAGDDIIFNAAQRILEHEMRLYGPVPDNKRSGLRINTLAKSTEDFGDVRKNKTVK